jgi:hypothetical protein
LNCQAQNKLLKRNNGSQPLIVNSNRRYKMIPATTNKRVEKHHTESLFEAARMYRKEGLNPIPSREDKRPVGSWAEYQKTFLPEEVFKDKLNGHCYGLGILTGIGSGSLEILDIDHKYDLTGNLVNDLFKMICDHDEELFNRLRIVRSPSYGFHLYYRCEKIQGNQKLAMRPTTEEERKSNPEELERVLVETRGLGGFIVAPPTQGYTVWQENEIPTITPDERDFILNVGRSFNQVFEVVQPKQERKFENGKSPYDLTPWDDYNERGDIIKLLENYSWEIDTKYKSQDRVFLIRPGKTKGYSADYNTRLKLFKCWSTSVAKFTPEKAYNHTAVFALLECNGDFGEATKKLEEIGYGKRKMQEEKSSKHETSNEETQTLDDFDHILITKEKNIPQEEPVIMIAGAAFVAAHNISTLAAQAKGGKTAIMNAMVSGSCSEDGEIEGFPDIKVKANVKKEAVIVFDTEQSEADQQYNLNTILKRAKLDKTPDYLRCFNIRKLDFKSYRSATQTICELLKVKFGGIHSIYIDGGADYIASVNDEDQSTEIIQFFIHLSINYDCPVILIVHQNPGGEKERGHFGSTIQRKCYGLLSISKEGDLFTLQPKMMRRAGTTDVPLIHFKYDKEAGYHIQSEQQDKEAIRNIKDRERLQEVAEQVFTGQRSYRHKDAVSQIMKVTSRKISTAKTMLENMEGFGFIIQGSDKNYRLNG